MITLDGQSLFRGSDHSVAADSWQRQTVEYGFAGLNSVVSTDLGRRVRQLMQSGILTADSVVDLENQIDLICSYIDGQAYVLVDERGVSRSHVRMDRFKRVGSVTVASQSRCKYEITYTQLSE